MSTLALPTPGPITSIAAAPCVYGTWDVSIVFITWTLSNQYLFRVILRDRCTQARHIASSKFLSMSKFPNYITISMYVFQNSRDGLNKLAIAASLIVNIDQGGVDRST